MNSSTTYKRESCDKVMFLHLSVILFMGGSLSRGGGLCRGVSVQGVSVQGGLSGRPPIWLHAGGTHPTGMHSCCEKTHITLSNYVS